MQINISVWLDAKEIADLFEMPIGKIEAVMPSFAEMVSTNKEGIKTDNKGTFYSIGLVLALTYKLDTTGARKFRSWAESLLTGSIEDVINLADRLSEKPELSAQGIPQVPFGDAIKQLLKSNKPSKK